MSRQAMERAISDIRSRAVMLPKARPYLLEVGERINDDIFGILPASTAYTDRCLVVTPSRIIGVGSDGSVDSWSYRDIARVKFGEGRKRFLGGHEPSYLFITLAGGTNLNFMLIAEHDYLYRVATLVEEVFRKARLERL